jgi:hypothetical protein
MGVERVFAVVLEISSGMLQARVRFELQCKRQRERHAMQEALRDGVVVDDSSFAKNASSSPRGTVVDGDMVVVGGEVGQGGAELVGELVGDWEEEEEFDYEDWDEEDEEDWDEEAEKGGEAAQAEWGAS